MKVTEDQQKPLGKGRKEKKDKGKGKNGVKKKDDGNYLTHLEKRKK